MADQPRRRLRRGVVIAVAAVLVVVVAAGVVLVVRSRQLERSTAALSAELSEAQDLDQALTTLDPTTLDPQVRALEKAEDVAPDDIRPAVATLADFTADLLDTVSTAPGDRQAALTDALAARQDDIDAVTAAGTEVQQWAEDNCGLSLAGVGTTLPTADPTTEAPTTTGAPASTGSSGASGSSTTASSTGSTTTTRPGTTTTTKATSTTTG